MPNEITVKVEDKIYTGVKSFSIEKDIENLSGVFSLTTSATDELGNFPIKPNDPYTVAIDDEAVITGFIDESSVDYEGGSHNITVTGRDKTQDFIDSTLEAKVFNPPIGFEALLKKLLEAVGYKVASNIKQIGLSSDNTISIINNFGIIEGFTTNEGIQLRNSEGAFALMKRLAEKRQIILNSNGDGNIVIAGIGQEIADTVLLNRKKAEGSTVGTQLANEENNNILKAKVVNSFQDRFSKYIIKSMTSPGGGGQVLFNGDQGSDPLKNSATPQSGTATDPDIRSSRIYTSMGSTAMNSSDCKNRAEWEANIRKTRGFTYTAEVFGFRQNLKDVFGNPALFELNPLWKPNQLVYVFDEFAGIDDELLIKKVRYSLTASRGSITEIELVDKNSYSKSIFEPLLRKLKDSEEIKLFFPQ